MEDGSRAHGTFFSAADELQIDSALVTPSCSLLCKFDSTETSVPNKHEQVITKINRNC